MTEPGTKPTDAVVELFDIWSRPGRWARQRAYLFLAINACVYAGLNVFVFWIQNNRLFDFSFASYASTYHKTLIDMLIFPLNVQDTPALIPIVGMLFGVIIIVPILVSQLYGFRYSILFAALVLLLAHLPVLSVFLVACSFVAGTSRHWLPFKFGVAVLSLLPLALYFYVATRDAPALQLKSVDPTLLNAPWVLAFLAAAGIAAAVLALANILRYRPGGILVSMIPFFAIPGVLFHHYIGIDQLEFRLLAARYGPGHWVNMSPIDITPRVVPETIASWQRYKVRDPQAIVDLISDVFPRVAHKLTHDRRIETIRACREFQRDHPHSKFLANQLYIRAMAEDMRFDHRILRQAWRVKYHADLVSPISSTLWVQLVEQFPDSMYSQAARLRLAILQTRQGHTQVAVTTLRELMDRMPNLLSADQQTRPVRPRRWWRIFSSPTRVDIPALNLVGIQQRAQKLIELIEHNADDPKFGNKPIAELLRLDRHHPKWRTNLLDLAVKYAGSKLHDNLIVMYTLTEPDPRALKKELERHVKRFHGRDAGVLALFELARITRELALVDMDEKADGEARNLYRRVIQEYPTYSMARQANRELHRLARLTRLTGG